MKELANHLRPHGDANWCRSDFAHLTCLFDPESSKITQRNNLQALLNAIDGSDSEQIQDLQNRYIVSDTPDPLPPYTVVMNVDVDRPLTTADVRAGIDELRAKSVAPMG